MPKLLLVSTTSWPTTARLAGAFKELSWQVEVMAPAGAPVRLSRFVDAVHGYTAFSPLSALKRAIQAAAADLIIPCDDRVVGQLLEVLEDAKQRGDQTLVAAITRALGSPRAHREMTDRAAFMAAAAQEGICVPPTCAIASLTDLEQGLCEFGLPAVLKSDGSWGGEGVAIVHTREEARAAFRKLSRPLSPLRGLARSLRRGDGHYVMAALSAPRPHLSLQAYVPGTPATTAFACWQGEVLAMIHTDVVVGSHSTGPASVVRAVEDAAMAAAARKLARRFDLSGLHGLDFIRDHAGTVHLLEINPRATQTAALALGQDRDLPAALAARFSSGSAPIRAASVAGDTVALFPQEWRRDPASNWLNSAHHDVPWADPELLRACLAPQRRRLWAKGAARVHYRGEPVSLLAGNPPAVTSGP